MSAKKKGRRWLRGLTLVAVAAVLGGVAWLGWRWQATLVCRQIEIVGAHHADHEALRRLARVDTGTVLFRIDPELVADRIERHPWVRAASATRLPTGTLHLRVEERVPVALALREDGTPVRYLDREGFPMPLGPGRAYDVPLLRGAPAPPHPTRPVDDPGLRELLDALARTDDATDALLSEFEWRDGDVYLYTTPYDGRGAVAVRLGSQGFAPRLERLHAFWRQAVLTRPDARFDLIDLRFDSQIVTREQTNDP